MVCIPIPNNFTADVGTPVLVWPAIPGVPGECYCPPYADLMLINFNDCLKTCNTSFTIQIVNGSICFSDLTEAMNNSLVSFVGLVDQCAFTDCFIRSVISSYKILIAGKVNYVRIYTT